MQLPVVPLPQIAPQRPARPTQDNVPPAREQREYLFKVVEQYVADRRPVPPLSVDDLREHAEAVLDQTGVEAKFIDYIAVLINNESWKEQIASVPYERRLLMLPKCLRDEEHCPAPFDEFGLLCKQCGLCSIQDLQEEAERLGYAVLTAEGSAIVTAIIETGKIDAIVGVSCLSVLERAFPYMEAAAIPGVAIPLLQDDCKDTNLDIEWLWEMIHLTGEDQTRRLDLDGLRRQVESWFTSEALEETLGPAESHPEQVARDWLARSGKRWRPFLAVCVWRALQNTPSTSRGRAGEGVKDATSIPASPNNQCATESADTLPQPLPQGRGGMQPQANDDIPLGLRKLAIAVECFHKASLIHDDIEDEDEVRYDEPTLHAEHGVPIALNVGDYLLGEGYRLISECGADPQAVVQMLRVAADGHRQLSIGQGEELKWLADPSPLRSQQVIDIFRRKTAPAFEVALKLGALYGWDGDDENALDEVLDTLHDYSESLGIAYQVRDDLDDFRGDIDSNDVEAMRLSICLSIAHERAKKDAKKLIGRVWQRNAPLNGELEKVKALCDELEVEHHAGHVKDVYKEQAVRCLRKLENANLKGLLRRVVGKIFDEIQIKGWCREHETRDAAGGEARAEPVA